jgi:hypothetical protein
MLDERKAAVLAALVEEHIRTGEPVRSRTILDHSPLHCSSATIRNEMVVLERDGYIVKPHTSAGRVPTDRGYRYYIDQLSADSLNVYVWQEFTWQDLGGGQQLPDGRRCPRLERLPEGDAHRGGCCDAAANDALHLLAQQRAQQRSLLFMFQRPAEIRHLSRRLAPAAAHEVPAERGEIVAVHPADAVVGELGGEADGPGAGLEGDQPVGDCQTQAVAVVTAVRDPHGPSPDS